MPLVLILADFFMSLLIRLDFVFATALLVVAPLLLLAASLRRPAVRRRLLAYWRASSLLMITVYLMIDGRPVAFVAGNAALVLIPLALHRGDALAMAGRYALGEGAGQWASGSGAGARSPPASAARACYLRCPRCSV